MSMLHSNLNIIFEIWFLHGFVFKKILFVSGRDELRYLISTNLIQIPPIHILPKTILYQRVGLFGYTISENIWIGYGYGVIRPESIPNRWYFIKTYFIIFFKKYFYYFNIFLYKILYYFSQSSWIRVRYGLCGFVLDTDMINKIDIIFGFGYNHH